ncbi:MAG: double zinc ribbon domain-containing protein [Alphaproteobacteria bacterium]
MGGAREIAVAGWHLRAARFALDVVFPPLCVGCRARVSEAHSLCGNCWREIHFLDGPVCEQCGTPFDVDPGGEAICGACMLHPHAFERARSVMRYDEVSKKLILRFKHSDRLDHAPAFGRWLERTGRALLEEADLIVPVPLHRWRLWFRRYNQSAILAAHLSRLCKRPWHPLLVERKRPTPSQGAMPSAKARRRNVLGAFRVRATARSMVKGRTVLLVDDVFTTGATLDACARALNRAGAARVFALTLARVVRAPTADI